MSIWLVHPEVMHALGPQGRLGRFRFLVMLQSRAEPHTRAEHDEQTKRNSHKVEASASARRLPRSDAACQCVREKMSGCASLAECGVGSLQGLAALQRSWGIFYVIYEDK